MHIPWPIYVLMILAVAAAIFVRNTIKLRKQFGSHTDEKDIRDRHPRARVFTLCNRNGTNHTEEAGEDLSKFRLADNPSERVSLVVSNCYSPLVPKK